MLGYIYELRCGDLTYIGSTTNDLKLRLTVHGCLYKQWTKGKGNWVSSFALFQKGEPTIHLLEAVDVNHKEELLKLEQEYITKNNFCVNIKYRMDNPRKATNRKASKNYYGKNKEEIQRRRLYKDIISGKRTNLTQEVIEKYDIRFDASGNIIIPQEYGPQTEVVCETVQKEYKLDRPVTLTQVYNFFETEYRTKDGAKPSVNTIKTKYKQLGTVLRKALDIEIDNDSTDVIPLVKDAQRLLKGITDNYENQNTRVLQIEKVLTAVDNYLPLKEQLDEKVIQLYRRASREARGDQVEKSINDTQTLKVYDWSQVKQLVKKDKGAESVEYLYLLTYEYVPVRDELLGLPLFKSDEIGNYAKLNRTGIKVILRDYKTKTKYEDREYVLPRGLSGKLFDTLGSDSRVLFPKDIHTRIKAVLDKYIFFPFGPNAENHQYAFSTGLRHTLVAYRNSDANPGLPRGKELARLMLHSQGTAQLVYNNKNIFTSKEVTEHKRLKK